MTTIHEMARNKLLIQAYNVFLLNKGVVLCTTDLSRIGSIQELEAEFMSMLIDTVINYEPCKEHTLVLMDTTSLYRLKTYKCVRCEHIELKQD